jgi:hypothetical protein
MALVKFRAAPLPNPPTEWDPQYMRQVIRVLEVYFSQLDGNSPNYAESYTADFFYGALAARGVTTAQKTALVGLQPGTMVFDTNLHKLCVWVGSHWETVTSA